MSTSSPVFFPFTYSSIFIIIPICSAHAPNATTSSLLRKFLPKSGRTTTSIAGEANTHEYDGNCLVFNALTLFHNADVDMTDVCIQRIYETIFLTATPVLFIAAKHRESVVFTWEFVIHVVLYSKFNLVSKGNWKQENHYWAKFFAMLPACHTIFHHPHFEYCWEWIVRFHTCNCDWRQVRHGDIVAGGQHIGICQHGKFCHRLVK